MICSSSSSLRRRNTGFSLVEVMVGLAIGMLAVIVMMQVFSVSEGYKRSTSGGSDATSEGAIAAYALQRDITQAGYGAAALDMFGCLVTVSTVDIPLAPVTINPPTSIVPAGDPNTDTLLVFYGSTAAQPQGQIGTVVLPAGNYYVMSSPCNRPPSTPPNPSPLTLTASAQNVAAIGTLYHLGTTMEPPKMLAYAVRNGNLTVCDYVVSNCSVVANVGDPTIWRAVASNVVSLRAQYGRDTLTVEPTTLPDPPPNYVVDTYDQTTPGGTWQNVCRNWPKIGAVRLAIVARSAQKEPVQLDSAGVPITGFDWDGGDHTQAGSTTNAPIDLTLQPNGTANPEWRNYRYKVFQTVIPLRNITWMGVQEASTCL